MEPGLPFLRCPSACIWRAQAPHGLPTLPDFAQASTLPAQPTIAFPPGPACYDCHLFRLKSGLRCHHQGCWSLTFDPPVSLPYSFSSCLQIASPVASLLAPFLLGYLFAILQGVVDRACIHISACTSHTLVLALIESGNKLVFHPDIHQGSACQLSSYVSHVISTSYGISEWPFWKEFSSQLSHEEILV